MNEAYDAPQFTAVVGVDRKGSYLHGFSVVSPEGSAISAMRRVIALRTAHPEERIPQVLDLEFKPVEVHYVLPTESGLQDIVANFVKDANGQPVNFDIPDDTAHNIPNVTKSFGQVDESDLPGQYL